MLIWFSPFLSGHSYTVSTGSTSSCLLLDICEYILISSPPLSYAFSAFILGGHLHFFVALTMWRTFKSPFPTLPFLPSWSIIFLLLSIRVGSFPNTWNFTCLKTYSLYFHLTLLQICSFSYQYYLSTNRRCSKSWSHLWLFILSRQPVINPAKFPWVQCCSPFMQIFKLVS